MKQVSKLQDDVIDLIFNNLSWSCRMGLSDGTVKDPGKYGWWIERIVPSTYGLYKQEYDGPDGDDWVSMIVRIYKGSVYVIDEYHTSSRHWNEEYFKDRYNNLPTGLTQGDLE